MRHSNAALVREWSCTQFWERNSPKNGLSCCIICSKIHSFTCAVSRTQYARCLKINDASIYRIQSMIESGDKYNSNPLGCMYSCMCVCVCLLLRTNDRSHTFECVYRIYRSIGIHIGSTSQRIHSVYVCLPLCYDVKSIISFISYSPARLLVCIFIFSSGFGFRSCSFLNEISP